MKFINRDEELLHYLTGEYSLLSSSINKIDIHLNNYKLSIDVYIDLLYSPNNKKLKLTFTDVIEYSFLYSNDYIFYNIESYKFFSDKMGFYISFDPYDEDNIISSNDQNYILCKRIEGFFI